MCFAVISQNDIKSFGIGFLIAGNKVKSVCPCHAPSSVTTLQNDIVSNVMAAMTAAIATQAYDKAWWVDAGGAIAISVYILWRWFDIAKGQVRSGVCNPTGQGDGGGKRGEQEWGAGEVAIGGEHLR